MNADMCVSAKVMGSSPVDGALWEQLMVHVRTVSQKNLACLTENFRGKARRAEKICHSCDVFLPRRRAVVNDSAILTKSVKPDFCLYPIGWARNFV